MTGIGYVFICLGFAFAGGVIGRLKGSSFFIWFVVSGLLPGLGLLGALLYRYETDEPDIACPRCGRVCKAYDAVCMRCGHELVYGDDAGAPGPDPDPVDRPPAATS